MQNRGTNDAETSKQLNNTLSRRHYAYIQQSFKVQEEFQGNQEGTSRVGMKATLCCIVIGWKGMSLSVAPEYNRHGTCDKYQGAKCDNEMHSHWMKGDA